MYGWGLRACPGPDLGQAAGLAGAGGGASFLQLPASRWDDNNESERGGVGARPGFLGPVALWLGKPPPPGLHHSGSYGDLRRRCPRTRLTRGGHLQPLQGRIWNFSDGSCLLLSLNQTPACGLLLPQLPPPPARPLQLALREERTPPQHGVEHLPGPLVKRSKAGLVLLPQHLRVAESLAGPGRWRGGTRRGSSLHPPGARRTEPHTGSNAGPRPGPRTHPGLCTLFWSPPKVPWPWRETGVQGEKGTANRGWGRWSARLRHGEWGAGTRRRPGAGRARDRRMGGPGEPGV